MVSKKIIVYGGRGNLGSTCVHYFKNASWWVANIDLNENQQADANIIVSGDASWAKQEEEVMNNLSTILKGQKVNAVICVAGGWTAGISNSLRAQAELMWKQSVWPSSIAATIAAKYLGPGGLLAFTGSKSALEGTPGMIGYGMAKAAVHQLTKSLGAKDFGLATDSLVVAILPEILDTQKNREWMPKAEYSTWTPLSYVAELFMTWAKGEDRPPTGSLVSLITRNNITTCDIEGRLIRKERQVSNVSASERDVNVDT